MFQPNENIDVTLGIQKHQVSGLLYIGNFLAAEQEIENAFNDNPNPSIAIICCTTKYKQDNHKKIREKVELAKAEKRLLHLDIGYGDLPPESDSRIPDQELDALFQEAYLFIDNALQNNIPVLVHCDAGSTRSATLIVAYLMRSANLSLAAAEQRILVARGTVQDADLRTQTYIRAPYANINNFRAYLTKLEHTFNDVHTISIAPPSQPALALPAGMEPIAPASTNSAAISSSTPKLLANVFRLENELDKIVTTMANTYNNKNNAYSEIKNLFSNQLALGTGLNIDKGTNTHQETLLEMSQLFQTLIEHKNKIDIHKNAKLDRFVLFKDNSSSWQSLLKDIRIIACAELKLAVTSMKQKNAPTDEIINFLKTQRNNPIFCLHRGNHWYEKFGVTHSVKQINEMITEYETELLQAKNPLQY